MPKTTAVTTMRFWPLLPMGLLLVMILAITFAHHYAKWQFNLLLTAFAMAACLGLIMCSFLLEMNQNLTWSVLWPSYAFAIPVIVVLVIAAAFVPMNFEDVHVPSTTD